jgi:transcriptional regulator with XRE-family HTH domain
MSAFLTTKQEKIMIKIGTKIKTLRKQKNISQEVFANYLGVSFQAVSKWENGTTMPDITMIPAIASFFGVSTDELFDFNLMEIEKQVDAICNEAYLYRESDAARAEAILRDGLKRFPGNDIILNNLLYTMDSGTRAEEMITLCKSLIASTKDDAVKYDACRILASCYKDNGQYDLIEPTLELIPEIYFSKLQLVASLLEGKVSYDAAQGHRNICADDLVEMLIIIGRYLEKTGQEDESRRQLAIARRIVEAFEDDPEVSRWLNFERFESLKA